MKNYAGIAKRIFSNGSDFDEEKLNKNATFVETMKEMLESLQYLEYVAMDQFLAEFYGDGWRNIRTYMDMMLEFSENYHWLCNFPPTSGFNTLMFAAHKNELNRLWDELESLADSDWQLENIQRSRLSCRYMIQNATWYTEYLLGTPTTQAAYRAANQSFYNDVVKFNVTWDEEGSFILFDDRKQPMSW